MADRQYLELKGKTWWYIRSIPKDLRPWTRPPFTGKANYRVSLQTSDVYQAQQRRAHHNAIFEREKQVATEAKRADNRDLLVGRAQGYQAFIQAGGSNDASDRRLIVQDMLESERDELIALHGEDAASAMWHRSLGISKGALIDEHLDQFHAEQGGAALTVYNRSQVIRSLAQWRSNLYLQSFNSQLVREYVDTVLAPGAKAATINHKLSILNQYWHWLMNKGFLAEGAVHWSKHRRKKARKSGEERERAFTDEEMIKLFCGKMKMRPDLLDVATAAALTGARQNEICSLRVKDLDFKKVLVHLPGEKTQSADRTIPLHTKLVPMFRRRCKDKTPDDYVFDELPDRKKGDIKPRASVISKAFTRFRRQVGVGLKADRSPVNFHSFRRWLAVQLKERNMPDELVKNLCGWSDGGMVQLYAWNAERQEHVRPFLETVSIPNGLRGKR